MLRYLFHVVIIFTIACGLNRQSNTKFAIRRVDNTVVSFNDTISPKVPVPRIVETKIDLLLKERQCQGCSDSVQLINIFEIAYSNSIIIYAIKIYPHEIYGDYEYHFLVYDNNINVVYSNCFVLEGYFSENQEQGFEGINKLIGSRPLLELVDINKDGIKEVLLRRRRHNGTLYNAAEASYLKIIPQKGMEVFLRIEEVAIQLREVDCLIKRNIEDLEIKNYLFCPAESKDSTYLGSVKVDVQCYSIIKKTENSEFNDMLITLKDCNEIEYLKGSVE